MKQAILDWYNAKIVKGWWRKFTVWIGVMAVFIPELMPLLADHVDLLADVIPYISDSTKSLIRLVALCIIPAAAAWKQAKVGAGLPPVDKIDPT